MPYEDEDPMFGRIPDPPPALNQMATLVIGAAIEVHRELGAGMPEDAYENALCLELTSRGISFERQKRVEIIYRGECVGLCRIDLLVEGKLVVEIKSVDQLAPVHRFKFSRTCESQSRSWAC